jgi:hypothetical protein
METTMRYYVDIDGTICNLNITPEGKNEYESAKPFEDRIDYLNKLYEEGHEIHYWTARGMSNGNLEAKKELTLRQLTEWGVKYTSVNFKKPHYDIWIDDKAINADEYFRLYKG